LRPETITAVGLSLQINDHPLHPPAFHAVGELGFEYFFKMILQSQTARRRPENKKRWANYAAEFAQAGSEKLDCFPAARQD
jgi:hypothetical protein